MKKTIYIFILFLVGLLLMFTCSTPQSSSGGNSSGSKPPKSSNALDSMPTSRMGLGVGVVNNKIYAIGGVNNGDFLKTVEVYDPVTNQWAALTDMPTARSGLGIAVVNNLIYTIGGGYRNGGAVTNYAIVELYDPATDKWSTLTSMPTARTGLGVAVVNNKIYAIGGMIVSIAGVTPVNNVEVYDPITGIWTTLASMPTARDAAIEVINNRIYAIGGSNGTNCLNTVEVYDPVTDTWSTLKSMSYARDGLEAASLNGILYAIGGISNGSTNCLNTVEKYNPVTNIWSSSSSISIGRADFGGAIVNNKVYIMGGCNINLAINYLSSIEEYKP